MGHSLLATAWDFFFAGRAPFIDTETVKIARTAAGYAFHAAPPGSPGKSVPTPLDIAWFRVDTRQFADHVVATKVTNIGYLLFNFQPIPFANAFATTSVKVAKQLNMRRSIGAEVYDTSKLTYQSPDQTEIDNLRTSKDPQNNTQTEVCYPRYMTLTEVNSANLYTGYPKPPMFAQCYILAAKIPGGAGLFVKNTQTNNYDSVDWQEIGSQRVWVAP